MKNSFLHFIFFSCIILLFSSCAQVVPLSGGAKDDKVPVLISSEPKNKQTAFSGSKIELLFDEYIKLNTTSQLLISPRLKEQPEINVNGKKIEIKWKDELLPNTTYHFNFGNSIADVTENNSITDFEFTFSTGDNIDSSYVKGILTDAYTLKPLTNSIVGLYTSDNDSCAFTIKSTYSARTTKDGSFKIPYLKKGTYKLVSIEDNNKNDVYDIGERIAFLSKPIKIDTNLNVNLLAFTEESPKLFVKKIAQQQPEKFLILLNKKLNKISDFTITSKNTVQKIKHQLIHQNNSDSVILYALNPDVNDTVSFCFRGLQDTATLILLGKKELNKQFERGRYPLELKLVQQDKNSTPYFSKLVVTSNFILNEINTDKMVALADGKEVKPNEIKKSNDSLLIFGDWQEQTNYQFYFYPGAIKDYFGRTNDTFQFNLKTTSKDDYGSLTISLNSVEGNKILQLVNSKNTIVFETKITTKAKLKVEHLLPENYFIRIIDDANNDNQFTSGNLIKQIQPEKINQYKESIKVLAGWENEIELPADFLSQ